MEASKKERKIKNFYTEYSDKIFYKRFNSLYPLRRYAHRLQYKTIIKYLNKDNKVLDAGCGEGVLSMLMVKSGINNVTGVDISEPNIKKAKELAIERNIDINFAIGDGENLPFADNSFDVVISSHVLEHLPSFDKGLNEIYRVTRDKAIIAVPTCLNFCAISQFGNANFWVLTKRVVLAIPWGVFRLLINIFGEGVDEGYGPEKAEHIWRYPWVVRRRIKKAGFKIVKQEASTLCIPYFNFLLPLVKLLDKIKDKPVIREFGYGTTFIIKK